MMTRCIKLCKILLIVMAICFVGVLVCVPFGVRGIMGQLNALSTQGIEAQVLQLNETVDTIVLHQDGSYGEILIRQSPNESTYLEIYNADVESRNDVCLTYGDQTTADLCMTYRFGQREASVDDLMQEMVFSMQGYPDAILYITPEDNLMLQDSDNGQYTSFRFDGPVRYANMPADQGAEAVIGDHWGVTTATQQEEQRQQELEQQFQAGYEQGFVDGEQQGYAQGYESGLQDGSTYGWEGEMQ